MAVKAAGSFYLLFNQLIPFELIVIIEMAKIHYTFFMEQDYLLLNSQTGSRLKVQNLSMHEEIGQIDYLFCDKTGTLTKNELLFRYVSTKEGVVARKDFLRCVLLCHEVYRVNGKLTGASQDELVLIEHAEKELGGKLLSRDKEQIEIEIEGVKEQYRVLKVHHFTSDRRMMSITVSCNGRTLNFGKGADQAILAKVGRQGEEDSKLISELQNFASQGLRTLMFACAELEITGAHDEDDDE
mmetsp:Transcript_32846/g.50197  ORF Transcript_32846/g.50197 Transcript_32846/m.50197 type:complete len:241 (+) Transcript_32846:953-1675(+)|eukprot:CAMPEP_0170484232 /NCGR_PEP_ID=MMETSP0208-20121228/3731_1 /TAXON_ID=197538 /ORGANISM="Strombidium inclinatum, Strain S3" /LENGTH=240 /DNA_ID=CAMNT_0010757507 /DNA_START=888 /DNA_END=1610 /DNA_ORIENTATION=+